MLKQYTGFDTDVLQEGMAVETTYHLMCEERVANFLIMECSETNLKLIDSKKEIVNITPKEVEDEHVVIKILK